MPCSLHEERLRGDQKYLMVWDGAWTYIPGQTDHSIPLAQGTSDVTTQSDGGWTKNLSGNSSGTLTCNGVYPWDDADVLGVFMNAFNTHEAVGIMEVIANPDGAIRIRRGCYDVTSFDMPTSTGGHVTYSIGGTLTGPLGEDDLPD